ncbi:hypothetical protein NDU88_001101 [Pleurodeles waltl]|uniref:Uncharacterized protein n=1 Tax=Pleurodeles waltl TaxID=8319 RepID=A0AAV7L8T5_PLEWA|nr:hypothetical protein NDU88_001101 [Pleurodeles waltl]
MSFRRGYDRLGDDTGDEYMDVVEVSASEVFVLLGVVMLVVDDDAVLAGVSVDETVSEVEEEEEGETVEAVDVVVFATVWCLRVCLWYEVWCLCFTVTQDVLSCVHTHLNLCMGWVGVEESGTAKW